MSTKYIILAQNGNEGKIIPFYFDEHKQALIYKQALIKTNSGTSIKFSIVNLALYVDVDTIIKREIKKQLSSDYAIQT